MTQEKDRSAGTVHRVAQVLRAIAEAAAPMAVSELAVHLSLPASTSHRLLRLLADEGMIERIKATRRYKPGLEFVRLSRLVQERHDASDLAMPHLAALVEDCGESAILCAYLPAKRAMTYARKVDSPHALSYRIALQTVRPLYLGASGLAILAWLPEADRNHVVANRPVAPATGRARSPKAMLAELALVRTRGYARTSGENIKGAVGIAAAVFQNGGHVIGSLCVTVPDIRFSPVVETEIAHTVMREAQALSAQLGAPPVPAQDA